jgi:hypothetical protein
MDGMGREKIPQISYRRAGDVSNFVNKTSRLFTAGTSLTVFTQAIGKLLGI